MVLSQWLSVWMVDMTPSLLHHNKCMNSCLWLVKLHFTALYCPALHYTVLHCTVITKLHPTPPSWPIPPAVLDSPATKCSLHPGHRRLQTVHCALSPVHCAHSAHSAHKCTVNSSHSVHSTQVAAWGESGKTPLVKLLLGDVAWTHLALLCLQLTLYTVHWDVCCILQDVYCIL